MTVAVMTFAVFGERVREALVHDRGRHMWDGMAEGSAVGTADEGPRRMPVDGMSSVPGLPGRGHC